MMPYSEHESVANVKIICEDGVLLSHKIVVASKNNFLKQLFSEIPVCDTITLFMPDYSQEDVEGTFCDLKSDGDIDLDLEDTLLPVKAELTEPDNIFEDEEKWPDEYKPKITPKRRFKIDRTRENRISFFQSKPSFTKSRKKPRNLTNGEHNITVVNEFEYNPPVKTSHGDKEEDKIKIDNGDLANEYLAESLNEVDQEQQSMISLALNYVPEPAPVIDTNLSYKQKSKIKAKIFELAKDYVKKGYVYLF